MDPLPILMDAPLPVEEAAAPLSAAPLSAAPLSVEEAEPGSGGVAMSQPAVVAVGLRPPPGQVHGQIRIRLSSGIVVSHLAPDAGLGMTHVLSPLCRPVLWPLSLKK